MAGAPKNVAREVGRQRRTL